MAWRRRGRSTTRRRGRNTKSRRARRPTKRVVAGENPSCSCWFLVVRERIGLWLLGFFRGWFEQNAFLLVDFSGFGKKCEIIGRFHIPGFFAMTLRGEVKRGKVVRASRREDGKSGMVAGARLPSVRARDLATLPRGRGYSHTRWTAGWRLDAE